MRIRSLAGRPKTRKSGATVFNSNAPKEAIDTTQSGPAFASMPTTLATTLPGAELSIDIGRGHTGTYLDPTPLLRTLAYAITVDIHEKLGVETTRIDAKAATAREEAKARREQVASASRMLTMQSGIFEAWLENLGQAEAKPYQPAPIPEGLADNQISSLSTFLEEFSIDQRQLTALWRTFAIEDRPNEIIVNGEGLKWLLAVCVAVTIGAAIYYSHPGFLLFSAIFAVAALYLHITAIRRRNAVARAFERASTQTQSARLAWSQCKKAIQTRCKTHQAATEAYVKNLEQDITLDLKTLQNRYDFRLSEIKKYLDNISENSMPYLSGLSDLVQFEGFVGNATVPFLRLGSMRINNDIVGRWLGGAPEAFLVNGPKICPLADSSPLGLEELDLPLSTSFAPGPGILLRGGASTRKQRVEALQSIALRLLSSIRPGRMRFTLIDPVGLGESFALIMALGDYGEVLIGSRAWTEPNQIEQQLADLTQHMETVIQKYLRADFKTIEEYNVHVGQVVEPYRILVVSDFPTGFSDIAAKRLVSIVQNGPRCGVFPVISMDAEAKPPYGFDSSALIRNMLHLDAIDEYRGANERIQVHDMALKGLLLKLEGKCDEDVAKNIVDAHGSKALQGMTVSVPFEELLHRTGIGQQSWIGTEAAQTRTCLEVPLGPSGARKFQDLVFGRGTAHHGLVIGQTGSGKSNLLHVLITALSLRYSPDELEFYLVDFKQGVEFKLYAEAKLPHARVIAIQSEREFCLSVLRGINDEMNRRGDEFRKIGVPNLSDWRAKTEQKMPRIVLLIDEFRSMFALQDGITAESIRLIDRLVSQGRAFGIHCVLASQTLAGGFSLPSSITDQMAVRIVLPCTEADSRLALSDDNPEARLLSRPGEAIYNDQRGMIAGNQRFQAADMGNDEARATLLRTELAKRLSEWKGPVSAPLVFEGHLPSKHNDCVALLSLVAQHSWPEASGPLELWLGEPISVKPTTSLRFSRQSGNNLLIVLRDELMALSVVQTALLSIGTQLSPDDAAFHVVDMGTADGPGAEVLRRLCGTFPHPSDIVGRRGLAGKLDAIHDELQRRAVEELPRRDSIFLVLFGLHRMRDLREAEGARSFRDDPSESLRSQLSAILHEGPEVGIHTLIWADTVASTDRIDRRMIDQCAKRVAGLMSDQESHKMIDDGAASKLDKPHRLICFDEDRPGDVEIFRPYAPPIVKTGGSLDEPDAAQPYCPPGNDWYRGVARRLAARRSAINHETVT